MPLIRVSNKTKEEIDNLKKRKGFQSIDMVVWNGTKELRNKKETKDITEPTQDFSIFKKSEDFSL